MSIKELDDRRRDSNLSAFAFALTLTSEEADLEELKISLEEIDTYPRTVFALWYRRYFEISCGSDFRKCLDGTCLYDNNRILPELEEKWEKLHDVKLTEENFKSQCWMLKWDEYDQRGRTSNLKRGIKLCFEQAPENRFDPNAYDKENIPGYLKVILENYQTKPDSRNAIDFVNFFEALDSSEKFENEWFCNSNCDPLNTCRDLFKNRCHLGIYLYHQRNTERACWIIGVDNIAGDIVGEYIRQKPQGKTDTLFIQYPSYAYEAQKGTVYSYGSDEVSIPENADNEVLVYYQYVQNDTNRQHWWDVCMKDIPSNKNNLLVVLPTNHQGTEDIVFPESVEYEMQQHCLENGRKIIYIDIIKRPAKNITVKIFGKEIMLLAPSPHILVQQGEVSDITADGFAVCSGEIKLACSDENSTLHWFVNNNECQTDNTNSLTIPPLDDDAFPQRISVKIKIEVNGSQKGIIRKEIIQLSEKEKKKILKEGSSTPELRILGKKSYKLQINGKEYELLLNDDSFMWWFQEGYRCENKYINEEISFSGSSELRFWSLCLPNDIAQEGITLCLSDGTELKLSKNSGLNGYARYNLEELLSDSINSEFVYGQESKQLTVSYKDHNLIAFVSSPTSYLICKNTCGDLGIYFPKDFNSGRKNFKVWILTDSSFEKLFKPYEIEIQLPQENQSDSFISLQKEIDRYSQDDDGELFLTAFTCENGYSLLSPAMNYLRGQIIKLRDGLSEPSEEAVGVFKELMGQYLRTLDNKHIYRQSRVFKYEKPINLTQCLEFWKKRSAQVALEKDFEKQFELLRDTLWTLLNSGYNFLFEPEWFFNALNDLLMNDNGKKYSAKIQNNIYMSLIDNRDKPIRNTVGCGLCPAIVAQKQIDDYAPLNNKDEKYKVRELTRLIGTSLKELGIGVEISPYKYPVTGTRKEKKNVYLAFGDRGNWELSLNRKKDCWEGIYDANFVLDAEKFVKAEREVFDGEEKTIFDETCFENKFNAVKQVFESIVKSEKLQPVIKDMMNALYDDLKDKCCDYSIIAITGLIICINNTVCRKNTPGKRLLSQTSDEYKMITEIVKKLYENKIDGVGEGDHNWRTLMRSICPIMGLISYFNFPIQ